MTATLSDIPGYVAGAWDIDPVHSDVSFTARHMMVSKVRGQFRTFSGEIVTGARFEDSAVTATIQLDSLDTNNDGRDGDIRGERFPRRGQLPDHDLPVDRRASRQRLLRHRR